MDYGIRSGKRLRLGMPMAPQDIQGQPKAYAWGCPWKASPLSPSFIGNFTWSYIFIRHMICVLLGASCIILVFAFSFTTIILSVHTFWQKPILLEFARILYVLHLYLQNLLVFALVLHLYLLEHDGGNILYKLLNSHALLRSI